MCSFLGVVRVEARAWWSFIWLFWFPTFLDILGEVTGRRWSQGWGATARRRWPWGRWRLRTRRWRVCWSTSTRRRTGQRWRWCASNGGEWTVWLGRPSPLPICTPLALRRSRGASSACGGSSSKGSRAHRSTAWCVATGEATRSLGYRRSAGTTTTCNLWCCGGCRSGILTWSSLHPPSIARCCNIYICTNA